MAETLWALGLAGFAGFVKYIQRFTAEPRPQWQWSGFSVHVFTGSFVGLLTLWLIAGQKLQPEYTHFAVAIAGYGGPLTLDFFAQVFKDTISRAAQKGADDAPKS